MSGPLSGTAAVARLRFREAVAGGVIWLVPLHFAVCLPLAASLGGPDRATRVEAADALTLALAAVFGAVAAILLGAAPLPVERGRPRGTLVLTAPVGAAARIAGTFLGAGAVLLLTLGGLLASALATVDLGAGVPPEPARARLAAAGLSGGAADPAREGLRWCTPAAPSIEVTVAEPSPGGRRAWLEPLPRVSATGGFPDVLRLRVSTGEGDGGRLVTGALNRPLELELPPRCASFTVTRLEGNFDLGLTRERCTVDGGAVARPLVRVLHGAALGGGLLALMAAAMALSTVTGSGVAAAAAATLLLLGLGRNLFAEAAVALAHAGAAERALAARTEEEGHRHGTEAGPATPPALAPLFRALGNTLPDASAFDLSPEVAAGRAPTAGPVVRRAAWGLLMAAAFAALATAGAARRP